MSFKFQDKEVDILLSLKSGGRVPIVCPFCQTKIDMFPTNHENDLYSMKWDFAYLCENCGINGYINVEYNIETITPIGGETQRIKP
jgi:hypothetical protein